MKSSKGKHNQDLNDENTFKNDRSCQMQVAENRRFEASKRNDANEISDDLARNEMLSFIKGDSDTLDNHKDSEVATFYKDRSVFLTGASGFVGKCLLEKLLRSCPNIANVFILIRPKRGKDAKERLQDLIKSELFDRLRNSSKGEEQLKKVVLINGDITKDYFGISNDDLELLKTRVSIIIHSAATVKFVEPLKVAVENNVISVENLINLASKLVKLETLVHVSTAYSNCDRKKVDEIFYESPMEAEKLIEMSRWMNNETLENISPILLGNRPNTYTYTKAIAESLLKERAQKLIPNVPIALVRPSIIGAIWRQPICGWVDNFNGPTGVILSMMTGAIQAMIGCPNYCADIVPVDVVANLIICTAWQVHQKHFNPIKMATRNSIEITKVDEEIKCSNKNINIYNCVSGTLNPVAWRDFSKYILQIGKVYPLNNLLRQPGTLLIPNEFLYKLYNILNHTTFAYVGDFIFKLTGKKAKLVIIHGRMKKMVNTLKPFTTNQWQFESDNMTQLYESMTPIDKEIFNFDIRQIRWDDYLRRYYIGSKIFALKDDPNELVKARYKLRRLATGSRLMQIILLIIAYFVLLNGSRIEETAFELLRDSYKMIC